MDVKENVLSIIGNTPIVKIHELTTGLEASVLAKLEYLNPSGSIKDRIALEMIENAEAAGVLRSGSIIVDASTGNTGIALSFVGAQKGYKVKIFETMPGKMTLERVKIMEAYGAEVKVIDLSGGKTKAEESVDGAEVELPGRKMARDLERSDPSVWWARQFDNPSNVSAHNKTGREILRQTGGRVSAFVAAIGTGGTLMGISQVLKEANPEARIVGVQPASSKIPVVPGKPYPRSEISGGIISNMIDANLVDKVVKVTDEEAVGMTHRLWREEGLFAGTSSGANVLVAINEAREMGKDDVVVTVLPDSADRYVYRGEQHFVT